ncbi:hypothetical protein [Blastococcus sp. SYSU D00820]
MTQPAPPSRGIGRGNALALAGLGVAFLLGLGVALLLVFTGGPGSPREAVEDYLAAGNERDWPAAYDLLCRAEQREAGSLREYVEASEESVLSRFEYEVGAFGPVESQGWGVQVSVRFEGESSDAEILVVEESGDYRVCGNT